VKLAKFEAGVSSDSARQSFYAAAKTCGSCFELPSVISTSHSEQA
jgi:hypothetical protein